MAISRLIDSNLVVDLVDTDKLFYNQYQFGLSFYLRGVSAMRYHHEDQDQYRNKIGYYFQMRNQLAGKYVGRNLKNYGGNWGSPQIPQTLDHSLDNLLDLADALQSHRQFIKLVVSLDRGVIYSNDLSLLTDIATRAYLTAVNIRQANPVRPRNKVCLRQSQFSHRSYFKERYFSNHEWKNLHNLLQNLQDIKLSASLAYWIQSMTEKNRGFHSRRYWYIDHQGSAVVTMMALVIPDIIRCTLPIELLNN